MCETTNVHIFYFWAVPCLVSHYYFLQRHSVDKATYNVTTFVMCFLHLGNSFYGLGYCQKQHLSYDVNGETSSKSLFKNV
jgi:hypothetical protein